MIFINYLSSNTIHSIVIHIMSWWSDDGRRPAQRQGRVQNLRRTRGRNLGRLWRKHRRRVAEVVEQQGPHFRERARRIVRPETRSRGRLGLESEVRAAFGKRCNLVAHRGEQVEQNNEGKVCRQVARPDRRRRTVVQLEEGVDVVARRSRETEGCFVFF